MPMLVNLDGSLVAPARGAGLGVRSRVPPRRQRLRGDPHLRWTALRAAGAPRAARALRGRASPSRRSGTRRAARRRSSARSRRARGGDARDPECAPWNQGERYIRLVMTRGAGEIGLDPALAVDPRRGGRRPAAARRRPRAPTGGREGRGRRRPARRARGGRSVGEVRRAPPARARLEAGAGRGRARGAPPRRRRAS